jgi:hypothetical protein
LGLLVGAFLAFLALGAGNAFAFSCEYDVNNSNDVVLVINNETVTVSKGSLDRIMVNGANCDGATTDNTETIYVIAQGSNNNGAGDHLIVDEVAGASSRASTARIRSAATRSRSSSSTAPATAITSTS